MVGGLCFHHLHRCAGGQRTGVGMSAVQSPGMGGGAHRPLGEVGSLVNSQWVHRPQPGLHCCRKPPLDGKWDCPMVQVKKLGQDEPECP